MSKKTSVPYPNDCKTTKKLKTELNNRFTFKETIIILTADFSMAAMQARSKWNIFNMLRKKIFNLEFCIK